MTRKLILSLATVATIAVAGLASTAADARGGGFGGGGFHGGGGFSHASFGRSLGGGGRSFSRMSYGRSLGHGYNRGYGHNHFNHFNHFTHWHHHGHWFFRGGRWIVLDGVDGGYDAPGYVEAPAPVAAVGPCTCLTKTYTQDGLVVFADVCTKEAASARVDGADISAAPPAPPAPPVRSSDVTPAPAPSTPDVSQAPTSNNFAGRTFQDFLAATKQAQKN